MTEKVELSLERYDELLETASENKLINETIKQCINNSKYDKWGDYSLKFDDLETLIQIIYKDYISNKKEVEYRIYKAQKDDNNE